VRCRFHPDRTRLLRDRVGGDGRAVHQHDGAVPVAGALHVLRLGAPDADHLQGACRSDRPVAHAQIRQVVT
jgi:hypothetical protein